MGMRRGRCGPGRGEVGSMRGGVHNRRLVLVHGRGCCGRKRHVGAGHASGEVPGAEDGLGVVQIGKTRKARSTGRRAGARDWGKQAVMP
jgi:hypothetical protein